MKCGQGMADDAYRQVSQTNRRKLQSGNICTRKGTSDLFLCHTVGDTKFCVDYICSYGPVWQNAVTSCTDLGQGLGDASYNGISGTMAIFNRELSDTVAGWDKAGTDRRGILAAAELLRVHTNGGCNAL